MDRRTIHFPYSLPLSVTLGTFTTRKLTKSSNIVLHRIFPLPHQSFSHRHAFAWILVRDFIMINWNNEVSMGGTSTLGHLPPDDSQRPLFGIRRILRSIETKTRWLISASQAMEKFGTLCAAAYSALFDYSGIFRFLTRTSAVTIGHEAHVRPVQTSEGTWIAPPKDVH